MAERWGLANNLATQAGEPRGMEHRGKIDRTGSLLQWQSCCGIEWTNIGQLIRKYVKSVSHRRIATTVCGC